MAQAGFGVTAAGGDLEALARLGLAALLGAVLGWPSRRRPGGLRTHSLVAAGAALFALAGVHVVGVRDAELLRVIQGVAGGIGFIGAATVLKSGGRIYGVGVAASIWVAGATGCEVAVGPVRFALGSTALLTLVSAAYGVLERHRVVGHVVAETHTDVRTR